MDNKLQTFFARVFSNINHGKSYLLLSRENKKRDIPINANGQRISAKCLKTSGNPLRVHISESEEKLAKNLSNIKDPDKYKEGVNMFSEKLNKKIPKSVDKLGAGNLNKSKVNIRTLDGPVLLKRKHLNDIRKSRTPHQAVLGGAQYKMRSKIQGLTPYVKGGNVLGGPINRKIN